MLARSLLCVIHGSVRAPSSDPALPPPPPSHGCPLPSGICSLEGFLEQATPVRSHIRPPVEIAPLHGCSFDYPSESGSSKTGAWLWSAARERHGMALGTWRWGAPTAGWFAASRAPLSVSHLCQERFNNLVEENAIQFNFNFIYVLCQVHTFLCLLFMCLWPVSYMFARVFRYPVCHLLSQTMFFSISTLPLNFVCEDF